MGNSFRKTCTRGVVYKEENAFTPRESPVEGQNPGGRGGARKRGRRVCGFAQSGANASPWATENDCSGGADSMVVLKVRRQRAQQEHSASRRELLAEVLQEQGGLRDAKCAPQSEVTQQFSSGPPSGVATMATASPPTNARLDSRTTESEPSVPHLIQSRSKTPPPTAVIKSGRYFPAGARSRSAVFQGRAGSLSPAPTRGKLARRRRRTWNPESSRRRPSRSGIDPNKILNKRRPAFSDRATHAVHGAARAAMAVENPHLSNVGLESAPPHASHQSPCAFYCGVGMGRGVLRSKPRAPPASTAFQALVPQQRYGDGKRVKTDAQAAAVSNAFTSRGNIESLGSSAGFSDASCVVAFPVSGRSLPHGSAPPGAAMPIVSPEQEGPPHARTRATPESATGGKTSPHWVESGFAAQWTLRIEDQTLSGSGGRPGGEEWLVWNNSLPSEVLGAKYLRKGDSPDSISIYFERGGTYMRINPQKEWRKQVHDGDRLIVADTVPVGQDICRTS